MGILSYMFFVLTGTMGFLACFVFNRMIYAQIKVVAFLRIKRSAEMILFFLPSSDRYSIVNSFQERCDAPSHHIRQTLLHLQSRKQELTWLQMEICFIPFPSFFCGFLGDLFLRCLMYLQYKFIPVPFLTDSSNVFFYLEKSASAVDLLRGIKRVFTHRSSKQGRFVWMTKNWHVGYFHLLFYLFGPFGACVSAAVERRVWMAPDIQPSESPPQ